MLTDRKYVRTNFWDKEILCDFWVIVCKTVCPMLSDRCLSLRPVLSVYNIGVLWRNG